MDFDRQAIERRDFPIGRRGYDPGAVDSHLRALASEFEELQRSAVTGGTDMSVASSAGTHVQSILEAAEHAASEIERNAQDSARQILEAANAEAARTREEALEKARAQVAAVAQVSTTLLERVGSMDAEVNALIASLRAGAGRLAADLSAVEGGMSELYGAASGRTAAVPPPPPPAPTVQAPAPAAPFEAALDTAMAAPAPEPAMAPAVSAETTAGGVDLDGARLIALNMALNGESRTDTERYLAENFELPDRLKLIDEVYAAIEG